MTSVTDRSTVVKIGVVVGTNVKRLIPVVDQGAALRAAAACTSAADSIWRATVSVTVPPARAVVSCP
jgi:hypothetical protein